MKGKQMGLDDERLLKYYQGTSDIEDKTARFNSYEVFHLKDECAKHFPDGCTEMMGNHIELPTFVDIPTIKIQNRLIAEAFCSFSDSRYDTFFDQSKDGTANEMYIMAVLVNNDIEEDIYIALNDITSSEDILELKEDIDEVLSMIKKSAADVFAVLWTDL